MIIDAHTHLHFEDFLSRTDEIIWRFRAIGWDKMVTVAITPDDFETAIKLVQQHPDLIKTTIWAHPCYVEQIASVQECKNQLIKQFQQYSDSIVAVGECGSDRYWPVSDEWYELQQQFLQMQCELAIELWLPLMIHSRADFEWSIETIGKYPQLDTYRHCRTYWIAEAQRVISVMKWKIRFGFGGVVTYKKSDELRECFKQLPLEMIFCETDAPYLAPQQVRWQQNEPSFVNYTYQFLADLLHMDVEKFSWMIEKNHQDFWRL